MCETLMLDVGAHEAYQNDQFNLTVGSYTKDLKS